MNECYRISFFGSSLLSAWWNGAATYYRGIVRALAERGHRITFYEPDAFERQAHRDIEPDRWARSVIFEPNEAAAGAAVEEASSDDLIVKCSGMGVLDEWLEREVATLAGQGHLVAFLDVDAAATLSRVEADPADPFRALVGRYDFIMTYGGGRPVIERYLALGARRCEPIYNALDPRDYYPTGSDPRFVADLALLANRMPDREARIEEFFFEAARRLPGRRFLLGGNGWEDGAARPANVRLLGHVYTADHNAFYGTPLAQLSVNRESMASNGWSPATRVFEAAGAGACLITDAWAGIEDFLEPGRECLVARNGAEVAALLEELTPEIAGEIGRAARRRVLQEHTYDRRALQIEALLAEIIDARRTAAR